MTEHCTITTTNNTQTTDKKTAITLVTCQLLFRKSTSYFLSFSLHFFQKIYIVFLKFLLHFSILFSFFLHFFHKSIPTCIFGVFSYTFSINLSGKSTSYFWSFFLQFSRKSSSFFFIFWSTLLLKTCQFAIGAIQTGKKIHENFNIFSPAST